MAKLTDEEIGQLQEMLQNDGISVGDSYVHTKLKQKNIKTSFVQEDGFEFTTYVPYIDMNKGVIHLDLNSIAEYLRSIKQYFTRDWIDEWTSEQRDKWQDVDYRPETRPFLLLYLSLKLENDNCGNGNPASRRRDLRKMGYTMTAITKPGEGYFYVMLPLPTHPEPQYETVPKQITQKLARLKRCVEAYSLSKMDEDFLLADHKFPESRWDENIPGVNDPNMSEEDILKKFQLLDNASNLRKKQMCDGCVQSGKRPSIQGIPFYYEGGEDWDPRIPPRGRAAEAGCIGCPWYDIEEWRRKLNEKINSL